jgi:hypothetical protein
MRRTAALTVTLIAATTLATPALGACGLTAESVAKAEVVFVGQLTEVSPDGNSAIFQVEEIWRGSVLVVGKGVGIDTTNSLQRLELPPPDAPPSSYLVLARVVGGQLHTGDSCEIFPFPWDASYAAFRPAGAPSPGESTTADGGFPGAVVAVGAALLVLSVVGVVAFARGRATNA